MVAAMVNHLWQSTAFVLMIALMVLMLREQRAAIRFWLWFAASIKFLVPFSLLAALGTGFASGLPPPFAVTEWTAGIERIAQPVPETSSLPSLALLIAAIWIAGSVVLLARRVVQYSSLAALLRSSVPGAALMTERGRLLPVRYTRAAVEPGVVGLWRPVLLLPFGIERRLSSTELEAVLAHELSHYRRRDNLTAAIHMLVEVVFWFHPLVWWVGARMVAERENACDEAVITQGHDPRTYAEGLLNVCEHHLARSMPLAAGVSGGDLKRRVITIMRSHPMTDMTFFRKLLLCCFAIFALTLPILTGYLVGGGDGVALAQNTDQAQAADEEVQPPEPPEPPELIVRVAPIYPQSAARQGLGGWVTVEFTVTETGTVTDVVVRESSNRIFEESAIAAASRFRYRPQTVNDEPVRVRGVRNLFVFEMD